MLLQVVRGLKREFSLSSDSYAVSCLSDILDFFILNRLIISLTLRSSICDSGRYASNSSFEQSPAYRVLLCSDTSSYSYWFRAELKTFFLKGFTVLLATPFSLRPPAPFNAGRSASSAFSAPSGQPLNSRLASLVKLSSIWDWHSISPLR